MIGWLLLPVEDMGLKGGWNVERFDRFGQPWKDCVGYCYMYIYTIYSVDIGILFYNSVRTR